MPNVLSNIKFTREPDLAERHLLRHAIVHGTSYQAIKVLERDYPLRVLVGGGGWYLGAMEDNMPLIRDSEWFETEEETRAALEGRSWTQILDL